MLAIRSTAIVVISACFLEGIRTSGEEVWKAEEGFSDILYRFRYRGIPVHDFADKYVCGSNGGNFYRLLKKHLCKTSSMFVYRFYLKLCQNHRSREDESVLHFLVASFFDLDSDGKISHYEKLGIQQY